MDYKNQLEYHLIVNSIMLKCHSMKDLKPTLKSVDQFNEFRKVGHDLYKKEKLCSEKLTAIHESYSKCIAYAPTDSEHLARAYGNRSALLLRMKKYQECIVDLDRALEIVDELDLEFKSKLLCRKVECLASLGSSESEKVFQEVIHLERNIKRENNNNTVRTSIQKAKEALFKLVKENSNQRNGASKKTIPMHKKILMAKEREDPLSSVRVGSNRSGKCLIAKENFEPGQIIFTEKAYVTCLNLKDAYSHCSYCLKRSWTTIPCDTCNWCMFCSAECKHLAWENHHDVECTVISYYLSAFSKIHYHDHLSLRILIKGIKEAGDLENFRIDLQSVDDWIAQSGKKCLKDQIFQSNGFKSIYASNSNLSVHLLRECALQTARMLMILSKFTSFFGENPLIRSYEEILQNESIMSIGPVFMKLRKKSYTNTFVYCGSSQSSVACSSHISSFINHSCNPNTKLCITDDQTLVVYSLQPIEENTKLSLSYHYAFYEEEKLARNDWMQDRTAPMCECEACRQTWPTLTQMYELPKVNPLIYAKRYLQEESDLFDEFDALVRPIIQRDRHVRYDQATVKRLAKALIKAMESLYQPSVVISELMFCLSLTFEKLYGPSLRR